MSADILLDCQGDLPVPPGYQVIESEVDFLRHATDSTPILIRGERLCAWAEAFYRLRGRSYQYQQSLSTALQSAFPALSQEQAQALAQKMGQISVTPEEVSPIFVLNRCYPADSLLWQDVPSRNHAARWLIWLCTHQPAEAESVVLQAFSGALSRLAGSAPEAPVYQATDQIQARQWLYRWLGLEENRDETDLGEFPLALPTELLSDIKAEWMKRLIATGGRYFDQMLAFPLPVPLRRELAGLAAEFYEHHNKRLTDESILLLQPYLSAETAAVLREALPPPAPSPLPIKEEAALAWFQFEYLPYRCWQAECGDEQARDQVHQHAQTFIRWYLERYPQWLLQPQWISFQQSAQLHESTESIITLCVILDGLPAWDAEDFAGQVSATIERLQLQQKSYCFAPLPTITEFAKDALLKGVPPRLAPQTTPLGKVLPDGDSPTQGLANAHPGDLLFWRVSQPDNAYHFEKASKRKREVKAKLDSIIGNLKEAVESLAASLTLQIVITSDHGRLLNAQSPRCLSIPHGMQAHGRAAWGKLEQEFDESGFAIDETADTIAIHGERFEMAHDMVIALGEESFQNVKSGYEPYPHGGLYPEEAIVPWFVFERDAKSPSLEISVCGTGEAENVGTLTVTITNPSRVALECLSVSLSHTPAAESHGQWAIAPVDKTEFTLSINPWPTKTELAGLKTTLLLRQPNGAIFTFKIAPTLQVKALYERDDSLLKELGL